jgi:hypothetical protein
MMEAEFGPLDKTKTNNELAGSVPGTTLHSAPDAIAPDPWMVTKGFAPPPGSQPAAGTGTAIASAGTPAAGGNVLPGFPNQQASDQFKSGVRNLSQGLGGGGGEGQGGGEPQGPPPMAMPPPQLHRANLAAGQQLAGLQQLPGQLTQSFLPPGSPNIGALNPWTTAQNLMIAQMMNAGLQPYVPFGTSLGSMGDGGFYG